MIDVTKSFILYAHCAISYDGRAKSELQPGNYVIIHKSDGTIMIHGGTLTIPLNYQPPGAVLKKTDNILTSSRKNETLTIRIYDIKHYYQINDWSTHKISIQYTEDDLREQIIRNMDKYFTNVTGIHKEFPTPFGPVDLLIIQQDTSHNIIELKRKHANISACTQVERYVKYFIECNINCQGYIMCPSISKGALNYASNHNIKFIEVDFEK
jgi:RecB family endonuclease NucS